MGNKNLHNAKRAKRDEFYTSLQDIENEVSHYASQLEGKKILCNGNDGLESNFWHYFKENFNRYKLKKLTAIAFSPVPPSYKLEYDGETVTKTPLRANGDFRTRESIELLKASDVVITNPPFSMFRIYMRQLEMYQKKFIILGNFLASSYKEIFDLILKDEISLGYNAGISAEFELPDSYSHYTRRCSDTSKKYGSLGNIGWFTNLDVFYKRELTSTTKYKKENYETYDGTDIINVDKLADLPIDYDGVMGVPLTYLCYLDREKYDLLGAVSMGKYLKLKAQINGKEKFRRILIQKKQSPPTK